MFNKVLMFLVWFTLGYITVMSVAGCGTEPMGPPLPPVVSTKAPPSPTPAPSVGTSAPTTVPLTFIAVGAGTPYAPVRLCNKPLPAEWAYCYQKHLYAIVTDIHGSQSWLYLPPGGYVAQHCHYVVVKACKVTR